MISFRELNICLLALLLFNCGFGQVPAGNNPGPYAVPTYECAGLYWKTSEAAPCKIRYKEIMSTTWKNGLDLVYDSRHGEYRGSIIKLIPNTNYQVELSTNSAKTQLKFKTRNDNFPVGKKTILPAGESDKTIVITESGTPEAYHLVTVPDNNKSVLNLKNVAENGIEIEADYVIVRDVEIRNAKIHGILIKEKRHDIVIEQCYITFWGRIGGPRNYGNLEGNFDSGISADQGTSNLTIQRNLIEDPRGASNDWETGHPNGPQGITVNQSKGGNVIRFNDILTTNDHPYNDAIGGRNNFSNVGNMNRDSDIYGNIIRNVRDDVIECEGANMNVRIWGNYAHSFYNGIATASTTFGPIYIFRNVLGESRTGYNNTWGGYFIKTGERDSFGGGRRYIFHNTALQPNGVFHAFSSHVNPNCISRNNIFDVPGRLATELEKEPASDYDYDYFTGITRGTAKEEHGIRISSHPSGPRLYVSSYKLEFYPSLTINTAVQIKNAMIDGGIILPGFNDDFKGTAPDIGAFEVGSPPLEFGRRAYLNYDEGWAPWEIY